VAAALFVSWCLCSNRVRVTGSRVPIRTWRRRVLVMMVVGPRG
jgi:hypothetical protein